MNKNIFLAELSAQFLRIFTEGKQGMDVTEQRLRSQGFIQAGELLQLVSRAEISALMASVHQQVYGQSVDERLAGKQRQAARRAALANGDMQFFSEPACQRQQQLPPRPQNPAG